MAELLDIDDTLEIHFTQLPSLIDAYIRLKTFEPDGPTTAKLRQLLENEIQFQLEFAASGQDPHE